MNKLHQSIEDHKKLFEQIDIKEEDVDYEKAKQDLLPFLELIDSFQTSIVVVFDFHKRDYFYVSKFFNDTFGFCKHQLSFVDHEFIRSRFHPDDFVINTGSMEALKFLYTQPIEKRKDFRLIHDFRILNDDEKWIRVIVQNDILELDKKGNIWLDLKLWDFSPIQNIEEPGQFILRNKKSNEIIYHLRGENNIDNKISNRERQILNLISCGNASKEIADKLFISVNTVNNHRRNIIKKLGVSNSSQAVNIASQMGVI